MDFKSTRHKRYILAAVKINIESNVKRACVLCALFLFLGVSQAHAVNWAEVKQSAEQQKLWEHKRWLRLGHYKCGWWSCVSEQDGPAFFLSPYGYSDTKAELIATIDAFAENKIRKFTSELPPQSARCQFPARLMWLSSKTGNWKTDPLLKGCKDYQDFKNKLDAYRASLVFSSYYLNNPSSAFGHTLLKLERKAIVESGGQGDLLSYGINYAAVPTTDNPVFYAILGLTGGFHGAYASMPYYYKVREYNDFESRDLWEYELKLTQEEIEFMVAHIWELGFSIFNYFYLTENCSYHLLSIIDVVRDDFNLLEPLPYWVIPVDTVKAIHQQPGLVGKTKHRVSLAHTLNARYETLNKKEKNEFFNLVEDYDVTKVTSSKVLDVAIDHFDVKHSQQLLKKDPEISKKKHKLLVKRSEFVEKPAPLPPDTEPSPHVSHGSMRYELAGGVREGISKDSNITLFAARFSLHDLLDPIEGYPPQSRLEMFYWDWFYDSEKKRIRWNRFRFVGIESMFSATRLWMRPAWRFDMGSERIQDARCFDCNAGVAGGGVGLAQDLKSKGLTVTPYFYVNARARIGKFVKDDITTEAGPSVGVRYHGPWDTSALLEYERRTIWYPNQDHYDVFSTQLQKNFGKEWAVKFSAEKVDEFDQWRIGVLRYQ